VDLLVALGNDKNATVEYGWSPIEVAAYTAHLKIMIFVLEHGTNFPIFQFPKHLTATAKYDGIN
jgi:ankyrin repeat protein